MPVLEDYNGSVNQSLYFARLLAEQAEALDTSTGNVSFYRQQQQCFCEASLDALYRALCFLVAAEMSEAGSAVSQVPRAPAELLAELDAACRLHPTPALSRLRSELQPGNALHGMLEAWQALWQARSARTAQADLLLAEKGIRAADCLLWREAIAELFHSGREQGAEY